MIGRRAVCLLPVALMACNREPSTHREIIPSQLGDFVFDYPPLPHRPVRVWVDAPADPSSAEILIVMHGMGRNGADYRADWTGLVVDHNVLVLAPEFSDEHFPGAEMYNLGNVQDQAGRPVPIEQWTFQIVEALFDHVKQEVRGQQPSYLLFGHSAGAQFVHRFIEFMPTHRARLAVAANAGWYTMPDDTVAFPYGLEGSPRKEWELGHALASNLVILLGSDDVDNQDDSLRRDSGSDAQGMNRLDRGLSFYKASRDAAARQSLPFAWRLTALPAVAHSHTDMAQAAASILLDGGG